MIFIRWVAGFEQGFKECRNQRQTRIGGDPTEFNELNLFAIKMSGESHGCHWGNSSWNPYSLQPGTVRARIIT